MEENIHFLISVLPFFIKLFFQIKTLITCFGAQPHVFDIEFKFELDIEQLN